MAMFKIFKLPQNQQFQYRPRFWEQEKEELEQRVRKIQNPDEVTPEEIKERISISFRSKSGVRDAEFRSKQVNKSNKILVLTILVLVFIAYMMLNLNIDRLLDFLS